MTSNTPRTDALLECVDGDAYLIEPTRLADLARQLERELVVLQEAMIDVGRSMDNGWSETLYLALDKVEAMRRTYEEGKK